MSTPTQLAAADIAKLRNMFAGFLAFGEGLEALGSIEQATIEANSRLHIAQDNLDTINAAADDTRKATDAAMGTADTVLANAKTQADHLTADALIEAADLVAHAKANAIAILSKAADDHTALTASLEHENTDLLLSIATGKDKLAELTDAIAERQAALDALNGHIAGVKAQIAGIG